MCYNYFVMTFKVETTKFDGPLDLMLHLIKEQKLDIFDLDMEVLTDQYINYLQKMEKLKLEIESEYLVELAILIVRRLLEYQKYKEVSDELNKAFMERQLQFSKPISLDYDDKELTYEQKLEGNPYDLLKAMNRILRRMQLSKPMETKFTTKEISTEERILIIKSKLSSLPRYFGFKELMLDCHNIEEVVVTFLAILDMAKDHYLFFTSNDNDEILFTRGDC